MGSNAQSFEESSRHGQTQSSPPISNQKKANNIHYHHKSERSADSDPLEDRRRRELKEKPIESDSEYYEDYDEASSSSLSNDEEVTEDLTSEKDSLMKELLYDTKEKWINPCGINFSAVIPLSRSLTHHTNITQVIHSVKPYTRS